jgi:2-polyprenyl-3-methyl-5-hydroxy-6-metoxy-1,4-benzoquinol methylase
MYATGSDALRKRSVFDQNTELLQRKAVRQIEQFYPRKGRLLDVGCGTGVFLLAAQQSGWDTLGLEGNPQAAAEARTRARNVKQGDLADEQWASASFDVVTLWQVLEHLPEPLPILRKLREALKPGGFLFVAVPNAASLQAKLLGRRWFNFQNPTHLIHFTFGTLSHLLSKAGFADARRLYFYGGRPGFGPLRDALQYPLRALGLGSEIRVCARKPYAPKQA